MSDMAFSRGGPELPSLPPEPDVRYRVQRDIPHPVLLAVARQAEAHELDLRMGGFERPKAPGAQVLLGLHLDGVDAVRPLRQKVDLSR